MLKGLWDDRPSGSTVPYRAPLLHKFPLSGEPDEHLQSVVNSIPQGTFTEPPTSSKELCFHSLSGGQILHGEGITLRIIHTPGHTQDSICLYLPEDGGLFTADSVLGHGTAVFENLSTYLSSLHSLLDYDYEDTGLKVLFPGHGPTIEGDAAQGTIQMYISHRLEREQQLIGLLKSKESWTVDDILAAVYPEHVRMMAKRGILLHLHKLELDGRVVRIKEETEGWRLVEPKNNVQ